MKWVSKGKRKKYTFKRFLKSFGYALCGIMSALKTEPNLLIEVFMGTLAIILGIVLKFTTIEYCIVILTIGLVIKTELLNTAIEYTVDMAMPEVHPLAKSAKDIAAGSVLFSVVCAIMVGLILYLPKIIALF